MTIEAGLAWSMVGAACGGLVWLIRLEGRVNTNEALHKSLKDDLNYIRARIDTALNGRH